MDRFVARRLAEVPARSQARHGSGDRRRSAWRRAPCGKGAKGIRWPRGYRGDRPIRRRSLPRGLHGQVCRRCLRLACLSEEIEERHCDAAREIDLVKARLKRAMEHYRVNYVKGAEP